VFSDDTSEEQAREYGRGRGTVDCCYPVKCGAGHYGELIFGQKRKIDILFSPMIYLARLVPRRPCHGLAGLPPGDGGAGEHQGRLHQGTRRLRRRTASATSRRWSRSPSRRWCPSSSSAR
jgi:hypothetical protein